MKAFEGTYSSQGNRLYLRIMEKQNKLVLHPYWGGDDVEFLPDPPSAVEWKGNHC